MKSKLAKVKAVGPGTMWYISFVVVTDRKVVDHCVGIFHARGDFPCQGGFSRWAGHLPWQSLKMCWVGRKDVLSVGQLGL